MTEFVGNPLAAPAAEPTAGPDPFGTFAVPAVPQDPAAIQNAIAGLESAFQRDPSHPLANRMDPRHDALIGYRDALYAAREKLRPAEVEAPITGQDLRSHLHNLGAFRGAMLDGEPVKPEGRDAANNALGAAVEALGLQRAEVSHLAMAIQAATTDAAKGRLPPPPERLSPEQEADVRDARALLSHLERKGHVGFRQALDRSGAGNDMRLIARMASVARSRGIAR